MNADTDHQVGVQNMGGAMLDLFSTTPEAVEGVTAFLEKRQPDFAPWA
jgi:naphthoate synthase